MSMPKQHPPSPIAPRARGIPSLLPPHEIPTRPYYTRHRSHIPALQYKLNPLIYNNIPATVIMVGMLHVSSIPVRSIANFGRPSTLRAAVAPSRARVQRLFATSSTQGVTKEIIKEGSGPSPQKGDKVRDDA